MATQTFTIKRNDRAKALELVCQDAAGVAANLSSASVVFNMREEGADTSVISRGAASIVDATAGVVRHDWAEGETAKAGRYLAEFEVTYASGLPQTFPNAKANALYVVIEPDLG